MSAASLKQDMPPQGGYRKFNFGRTFPKMVWRPGTVVGVLFGVTSYGVYQAIEHKKLLMTEKFEDVDLNSAIQPFLVAERDRNWLRLLKKNRDLEDKVMADVPGWKTGTWYGEPVYLTLGQKWWDPTEHEFFSHSAQHKLDTEHTWRHHDEYAAPKFYDKWIPKAIAEYIW